MEQIFLVGNPNVGKSSVFNQLTGVRQKTANYPGVTVERKLGKFQNHPIIDLPGLKSVWSESVDEQVSVQELLKLNPDKGRVLFIADGMNLEQDLFLFSQVADLQIPLILLINYKDEVEKQALQIDVAKLSQQLGCKVSLFSAKTGDGLAELETMIKGDEFTKPNTFIRTQYDVANAQGIFNNTLKNSIEDFHQQSHSKEQLEMVQNDFSSRQSLVNRIVDATIVQKNITDFRTDKIDAIALHPIWGSIIFFLLLLFIFQSIFSFSSIPMDMIDGFFWRRICLGTKHLTACLVGRFSW